MRSTAPFAVSAAPAEALKPLVGDVKRLSSKSLWAELDDKFRDFSMMSMSSFAPDEFDEEEQRLLIKFLRILEKWGYSRVFQRLMHSQGGQRIRGWRHNAVNSSSGRCRKGKHPEDWQP